MAGRRGAISSACGGGDFELRRSWPKFIDSSSLRDARLFVWLRAARNCMFLAFHPTAFTGLNLSKLCKLSLGAQRRVQWFFAVDAFLFQRQQLEQLPVSLSLAVLSPSSTVCSGASVEISVLASPSFKARTRAARSCAVRRSSATGDLAATVGVSSPVRSGLTTSADAEETRLGATGARFRRTSTWTVFRTPPTDGPVRSLLASILLRQFAT